MKTHSVELLGRFVEERNTHKDIVCAIGYGSNVISQSPSKNITLPSEVKRTDAILIVKNSKNFHEHTIKEFPDDYSWIRYLGPNIVTALQRTGGMISYNLLRYKGEPLKYGVIEENDTLDDFLYWKYLFVAGRFQKPYEEIIAPESTRLQEALHMNRLYALKVAGVLLQDKNFTEEDLYSMITSLSYLGDPRFEDPQKIAKISKNIKGFRTLYHNELTQVFEEKFFLQNSKKFITVTPAISDTLLSQLPRTIQLLSTKHTESVQSINYALKSAIKKIVATPATIQIPKGLLTAGLIESIKYATEKIKKSMQS